ncbi:hypothetical protein CB1_000968003 [Camelus ferus]|nr:hypothetical protein CB1_000968003 [Camelus ferus]
MLSDPQKLEDTDALMKNSRLIFSPSAKTRDPTTVTYTTWNRVGGYVHSQAAYNKGQGETKKVHKVVVLSAVCSQGGINSRVTSGMQIRPAGFANVPPFYFFTCSISLNLQLLSTFLQNGINYTNGIA